MLMLFNFFQTVGFYGFVAWTPTLLIAKGIHVTQSLEYSTIINVAAVAFPLLIMLFADRIERKWHCCLSCLCIAVFGIWFASVDGSWALIALGACLAMAAQWLSYALHNYQAELYPTRIRARGVGFVYSWSRLSGILTPFFIAFFLRDFGADGRLPVRCGVHGGGHSVRCHAGPAYPAVGGGGDRALTHVQSNRQRWVSLR